MQINKINNNMNFKARAEVHIGEEFLAHLRYIEPKQSATILNGILESAEILKTMAKDICTDTDVVTLRNYKNRELDLMLNGNYCGTVNSNSDLFNDVKDGILHCLKIISIRRNPADKQIDLSNISTISDKLFYPIKGRKDAVTMSTATKHNGKNVLINPETVLIEDYINKVRALNTIG